MQRSLVDFPPPSARQFGGSSGFVFREPVICSRSSITSPATRLGSGGCSNLAASKHRSGVPGRLPGQPRERRGAAVLTLPRCALVNHYIAGLCGFVNCGGTIRGHRSTSCARCLGGSDFPTIISHHIAMPSGHSLTLRQADQARTVWVAAGQG